MSAPSRLTQRRVQAEFRDFHDGGDNPNVKMGCFEENLFKWYYMIHGLEQYPYNGGVYIGTLELPDDFPKRAPVFKMMTPSGRFEPGKTICTTASHFHPEAWSPSWTVQGCIIGLMSIMLEDDPENTGVGAVKLSECSEENRAILAKQSLEWNKKNWTTVINGERRDVYMELFSKFIEVPETVPTETVLTETVLTETVPTETVPTEEIEFPEFIDGERSVNNEK